MIRIILTINYLTLKNLKSNRMRNIYLFITLIYSISFAQENNLELLYQWSDETISGDNWVGNIYNEVWGFTQNGHEFAVIGSTEGMHIIDVTDPVNSYLVVSIEGGSTSPSVVHRDFHTYNGYLYAVADEENESTLQIVDLNNLPNSVEVIYDSNDIITRSHNIFIDEENEIMYTCGGKINGQSNYLSLISLEDPTNPIFITNYNTHGYVHDIYVKNNIGYLNCGSNGFHIVDFSDSSNPQTMGSLTDYPFKGYNHSGWLTEDGNTYVLADENHGYRMKVCDVSNPSDIEIYTNLLLSDVGEENDESIAHNLIIKNNLLYVSHYHDGLWIWDISNPDNPTYVASYDTYPEDGHSSYRGAWGVYPLLPSGNILVSDMQSGLFVFAPPTENNTKISERVHSILYPNPFSNIINIETSSNTTKTVEIYNIKGKQVFNKTSNEKRISITLESYKTGIYFLKIHDTFNSSEHKIVKY